MSLIIIFVNDVGLNWVQSVKGDSFGMGVIFAIFHNKGTHCCCIEEFNTLVIAGTRYCEKSFHNQYGSDDGLQQLLGPDAKDDHAPSIPEFCSSRVTNYTV